jgi:tRNA (cmo5U34)-methyltransferase
MVINTRKKFLDQKNVKIVNQDASNDSFCFSNASLIATILTCQFISYNKRVKLIKKIYEGLNIGGAFIYVEKCLSDNPLIDSIFTDLYHDMKLDHGFNEKEVMDKSRSIRGVMKPLTVTDNYKILHKAGFQQIDIFYKQNQFTGFLAIKGIDDNTYGK